MKVFIVGVSGGTGRLLADQLVAEGYEVGGLIRRPEQAEPLARRGVRATLGDLVTMSIAELTAAVKGADVIVFSAGAGGSDGERGTFLIDGRGPGKVATAASQAGVERFILVSVFPEALRDRNLGPDFEQYMVEKKNADVDITTRSLDWVIVRPSSLQNGPGTGHVSLGFAEIHEQIPREDVASTIAAIIAEPHISRVILEVTTGPRAIKAAVAALAS